MPVASCLHLERSGCVATFTQRAHICPFLHLSRNCGCMLPLFPPPYTPVHLLRLPGNCSCQSPSSPEIATNSCLHDTCARAPAARQPLLPADSLPPASLLLPLSPDLQTDEDRTQEILAATTRRIKDLGQQGRMKDAIQVRLMGWHTRRVPTVVAVGLWGSRGA